MKGVIPDRLGKLVVSKYGKEKWSYILEKAGLASQSTFLMTKDIPDEDVLKVVDETRKALGLTLSQIADMYGEYWVTEYATKIYRAYYKGNSAKEFLLNMDKVHQTVIQNIKNANPPRFDYEWKDEKTLIMIYKSERGLIDFLVGLIKGVGKYFNENISVIKLGMDRVQIRFS